MAQSLTGPRLLRPRKSPLAFDSRSLLLLFDGYFGLFLSAFLAATLLPAFSELLFAGLLLDGYQPFALWLCATTGNTLGAALNWWMGRYLLHYQERAWFPFKSDALGPAQRWFQRYGVWSLLLAWAPLIGDALTFIAGLMRVRFALFILLTGVGKGARYLLVLGLLQGFFI